MGDVLPFGKPKDREQRVTLTQKQKIEQFERLWVKQNRRCAYCQCLMTREPERMNTACREHVEPGKFGGCKNDADSNIVLACWICNIKKGSRRDYK